MTTATAAPKPASDPQVLGAQMIALVEGRGHLAAILGSDSATVERFKTVVLSALTSSPKLLQADPATLVQAIREAAMWNLEPDGVDANIIPYWNSKRSVYEADFQVTARGYVTVLYRSPRVLFVDADLVYENDVFEYEKGAVPRLVHRPLIFGDRGKRIGAYALVQLDTGFMRPIVLDEKAITARRRHSRESETGTWAEWPDEMARKTALRALMSLVPIERGVKAALATEDRKYPALAPVAPLPEITAGPTPAVPAIEAARAAFLPAPEPTVEEPETSEGAAVIGAPPLVVTDQPDGIVNADEAGEGAPAIVKCGSLSDPALGEIEECVMATGHLDVAGSQQRHRAESGSIWPAAKGRAS
jgi:recombination protein RecT